MTEIRSDTRPIQINQKDANQDQEIALLKHRIEDAEQMAEELRDRVRKLERWVWRAGAVISAAITLVGLIAAIPDDADARSFYEEDKSIGVLTHQIRQWESEKNRTPSDDVIDNALKEWEAWKQ